MSYWLRLFGVKTGHTRRTCCCPSWTSGCGEDQTAAGCEKGEVNFRASEDESEAFSWKLSGFVKSFILVWFVLSVASIFSICFLWLEWCGLSGNILMTNMIMHTIKLLNLAMSAVSQRFLKSARRFLTFSGLSLTSLLCIKGNRQIELRRLGI